MISFIRRFASDTKGASAVEYGLIAASIAVAIIVAVSTFGEQPPSAYGTFHASAEE